MVEQQTVELENLGSNPAARKFFRAMLQHFTSNRMYKIPTKMDVRLNFSVHGAIKQMIKDPMTLYCHVLCPSTSI